MVQKIAVAATLALPALTMARAMPKPFPIPGDGKIVGGEPAAEGDFPFIVSLQEGGSHFCGGTLIDSTTVVTAAHCSVGQDPASSQVRGNTLSWSSGGTQVGVSSITVHPDYDSSTTNNDVAVWKLSEPIDTSFASLPAAGSEPTGDVTVAGWGTTEEGGSSLPDELMKVVVPIVDRETCRAQYGADSITDGMVCAGLEEGGKDSCQGDSGGPLLDASGALVGIVSWGQGCAQAGFSGVYANTAAYIDFITSV